jgi:hypothetical protein
MWMAAICLALCGALVGTGDEPKFRLSTFTADVTIPLGHRCMGILPQKSQSIADPLEARGFVLQTPDGALVLAAIDWCEIRNGAYDEWRDSLAKAAGTTRERVLVCALHQHDAPVCDSGAQALLDEVGLKQELYDREFHAACLRDVAKALEGSLAKAQPVTHIGVGRAAVEKIASSRRVVLPNGRIDYNRYSASGGDAFHRDADEGPIDPQLRIISFWHEEKPLAALHCYATHPMSYYGRGEVSADFVGLARRLRQREQPDVFQIYVSGCSGDVTAGKYNDGSQALRGILAERLHRGMQRAWEATQRHELANVAFRSAPLRLEFHDGVAFTRGALEKTLRDAKASESERILAAMSLSSLNRLEQPIDVPCIDLGDAQIVLLPGESFVGYQLLAQKLREEKKPASTVMTIGYGECWPGYIPTEAAFDEGFNHDWRWVRRGSEARIKAALEKVLLP